MKSVEKLNAICILLLKLVYVNALWLLCTLCGGVIFGIGPATYAAVSVCRQWVRGKDVPVASTFWHYVKEGYKEATTVSLLYMFAGTVLIVDLLFVTQWYVKGLLFLLLFAYGLSLLFIFPVMANYDVKGMFFKIKTAFWIGLSFLQYSLVTTLLIAVFYGLFWSIFPGILVFLGASLPLFLLAWMGNQVFTRMEALHHNETKQSKRGKHNEQTHDLKIG